jgi:hypothetical protein
MLNGIDPIVIFNFFKKAPVDEDSLSEFPFVAFFREEQPFPPIPVYLSARLTGLHIITEEKNIDIETRPEGLSFPDGEIPPVNQRGLNSVVSVSMEANKKSIGVVLLSALCEYIFSRVTAQEYSITYLSGPVTVFNGLLHGFSIQQDANTDKFSLNLQISRARNFTKSKGVVPISNANNLSDLVVVGN